MCVHLPGLGSTGGGVKLRLEVRHPARRTVFTSCGPALYLSKPGSPSATQGGCEDLPERVSAGAGWNHPGEVPGIQTGALRCPRCPTSCGQKVNGTHVIEGRRGRPRGGRTTAEIPLANPGGGEDVTAHALPGRPAQGPSSHHCLRSDPLLSAGSRRRDSRQYRASRSADCQTLK